MDSWIGRTSGRAWAAESERARASVGGRGCGHGVGGWGVSPRQKRNIPRSKPPRNSTIPMRKPLPWTPPRLPPRPTRENSRSRSERGLGRPSHSSSRKGAVLSRPEGLVRPSQKSQRKPNQSLSSFCIDAGCDWARLEK